MSETHTPPARPHVPTASEDDPDGDGPDEFPTTPHGESSRGPSSGRSHGPAGPATSVPALSFPVAPASASGNGGGRGPAISVSPSRVSSAARQFGVIPTPTTPFKVPIDGGARAVSSSASGPAADPADGAFASHTEPGFVLPEVRVPEASPRSVPPPLPGLPPPTPPLSTVPLSVVPVATPIPTPPPASHLAVQPPQTAYRNTTPLAGGSTGPIVTTAGGATTVRADVVGSGVRPAAARIVRSRAYSFVLDPEGKPVEIGSGRSAKAYLGEERWLESKTDFRRDIVIKILQKGVTEEDAMRFQMEKELVERVQGHPNIVHLFASGESDDPAFIPAAIRDKVECEFMILERLEMSLEERLKGSRQRGKRDDLLAVEGRERIFRVLDYMIPIASAIEYAHLERNVCHRDLKPANVLIRLPNPSLRGSTLEVRLADFNVAKQEDADVNYQMTRAHMQNVPGTLFFQSPEQETNVIELLVNVTQGSQEVEFFEDFYIQIEKNDTFVLFNHSETYPILYADRSRKKIMLGQAYDGPSESSVRAKVQKSVGRPADIYSIGALFYYLISGAYANPKTLYDNFHKFIEYERVDELNTIQAYLEHEYSVINSLRAPKAEQGAEVAPADRFFSYKHYLDGNGDLIDANIMSIIAKCMIRNKPDSYCQAHDIETRGISDVVGDMIDLYTVLGMHPSAQPAALGRLGTSAGSRRVLGRSLRNFGQRLRWMWLAFVRRFTRRR